MPSEEPPFFPIATEPEAQPTDPPLREAVLRFGAAAALIDTDLKLDPIADGGFATRYDLTGMHKCIRATTDLLDKAESALGIKKLHPTRCHRASL
jgi:hypothetical protein